jgi:hypothetical protein
VLVPNAPHFLLVFHDTRRLFSVVVQLLLSTTSVIGFLDLSSSFHRIGLRHLFYLDKLRTKSDRVWLNYQAQAQLHLGVDTEKDLEGGAPLIPWQI